MEDFWPEQQDLLDLFKQEARSRYHELRAKQMMSEAEYLNKRWDESSTSQKFTWSLTISGARRSVLIREGRSDVNKLQHEEWEMTVQTPLSWEETVDSRS
jgi:hypothetical protein